MSIHTPIILRSTMIFCSKATQTVPTRLTEGNASSEFNLAFTKIIRTISEILCLKLKTLSLKKNVYYEGIITTFLVVNSYD